MSAPLDIVVVGGGIAGIAAAYLLGKRHRVTLVERNDYVGGHTNTIAVDDPRRPDLPVDTGFIVCNPRTYPLFYRLLDEWGVGLRDSEMSFGYFCERSGLGYVGPSIAEFARRWTNFLKPVFLRMVLEQRRFNRRATADLRRGALDDVPLDRYLDDVGASDVFRTHYLVPLAAAIWSSPDDDMLRFPAATFVRFFLNHGMLDLADRPTWQTVVGGSQAYVRAFRAAFRGEILTGSPVRSVRRREDGVSIELHDGRAMEADHVVLAAHADESLALLADPTGTESEALSAWRYHRNPVLLHTDASVLPRDRRLWASWNYCRPATAAPDAPISITYYMNRLQGLDAARDYFVSLNAADAVDPASVVHAVEYTHPAYTPRSVAAQRVLRETSGANRTSYCGSYLGYGFHEDAVASAVAAAERLGAAP